MKVASKIVLASSLVMALTVSILTWIQYSQVKDAMQAQSSQSIDEVSEAISLQLTNWFTGKLEQIDFASQMIDANFNNEQIKNTLNTPILKDNFILIFGGLDIDGKVISNDANWNPSAWDARQRPWYPIAKNGQHAMITAPYIDSKTKDTIISVVAKITDKGVFKGAFGGDLSLKAVSDSLNTLTFNDAGYAFLLNSKGNIISHPDTKYNNKNYQQLFSGQALSLDKKNQEITVNGQNKWVSFTPVKGLRGLNWYIGVVIDTDTVMAEANNMKQSTLIGVVISIILSVLVLGSVVKVLLKPINLLSQSLTNINGGNGDLTQRLPIISNDEFSDLAVKFNLFLTHLQDMILNVKQYASEVGKNTDIVEHHAVQASQELHEQLCELDQLATAMNEMASTAVAIANNAQVAEKSANTAGVETENGVVIVATATESINRLALQLDKAVESVAELTNYSNNIESIVSVITAIADQTNLLALNAAIEAARAGDKGRGFAVVADEVRSLASRTQDSTSEIKLMIEQLQSGVLKAESIIKQSQETAMDTSDEASKANDSLDSIRLSIIAIHDMNIQIAAAAEEQSATAEEINRNTTNIRDISQQVSEGGKEQVSHIKNVQKEMVQQGVILNQFNV